MHPSFQSSLDLLQQEPDATRSGPTNQQIVDAANAAYRTYRQAVDAITIALVNSVNDKRLAPDIAAMDGADWLNDDVASEIATPLLDSSDMQTAASVAKSTSNLQCISAAVFVGRLPVAAGSSRPGMIGFARGISGSGHLRGFELELDILSSVLKVSPTHNLQYALWVKAADTLQDRLCGLFVKSEYRDTKIVLMLLLTMELLPYGFAVSSGIDIRVPVSSGVFAGETAPWQAA
jgi:hypothetical protein